MLPFAKKYFLVFGLATIAGGISGFVIAHSIPSIIAGTISGILLIVAGLMLGTKANTGGLAISLLVSLALAGRFSAALFAGKLNPALYIVPLSVAGVCIAALLLFQPEK